MKQIEGIIREGLQPVKAALGGVAGLADMFENCFLSTIQTTARWQEDGSVFVITGDIPAMWLRDSSAQVAHYIRFCAEQPVRRLIRGLLRQQARLILLDPYANAFNQAPSDRDNGDRPRPSPWVWEQKYEIDSLCYPMWLAAHYYEKSGDMAWLDEDFHRAMRRVVDVFETEQRHDARSPYYFLRRDCPPQDTLSHFGHGAPTAYTGMTWSGFRPSDDACVYGYLVPANYFAARALKDIALFAVLREDGELSRRAKRLREQILAGLECYARVEHPQFGTMLAYETDGQGRHVLMDDANVPSLLSLPYLGAMAADDPIYQNTRRFVLSRKNPFYAEGRFARGVGSPHTPRGYVWHISLCIQMMTTDDAGEQAALLRMLLDTHAGTGFMHEGFDPDAPAAFTRPWFAWANSLFGECVWRLHDQGRLGEVLAMLKA